MQRRRHRNSPRVEPLEARQLLSAEGLSGAWIGQDGHDLVGPSTQVGPSDVQDVRLALTGLRADRTVVSVVAEGLGGGAWTTNTGTGVWAAAFVRSNASTGDFYFEPYQVETGRSFNVTVAYDDGTAASCWIVGGAADPQLRVASAAMQVFWVGQDGRDLASRSAAVGPDGVQDAVLSLANLSTHVPIAMIRVEGPPGISWSYGPDRQARAEARLVPDAADPSRASLLISPDRNLDGVDLNVQVVYATGAIDTATIRAGETDPTLSPPADAPLPTIRPGASATWAGQDAAGNVRLALGAPPPGRSIVAAVLTNASGRDWVYRGPSAPADLHVDPYSMAMDFVAEPPGAWSLAFPPLRNETGTTLTLRLLYDDGTIGLATVAGGVADPGRLSALPAATSIVARPGDNLQALVNAYGTVKLSAGVHDLSAPLVLGGPLTLLGDPGAVLRFTQAPGDAPWTSAIKVHASNTTLDGFALRFGGPVRWDQDVSYGPAVIGTTDERDNRPSTILVGLAFTRLDLEAPPAANLSGWERAPGLLRLMSAESGRIEGNTLHGGMIEFDHGPWTITGNTYTGTPAGTFADAVFAGHETAGLVLSNNVAEPRAGSGKTWRFLVLTVSGDGDTVRDNRVVGVGPRDDDTIPQANAAEIILTESYRVRFEGLPSRISDDGRIVRLSAAPGGTPEAGEVLAVLEGPAAGTWRRIAQVLDPRTILLDTPLPQEARGVALSIGAGFVGLEVAGNMIDTRGSSLAANLMLVGSQFGTRVVDNTLQGGRHALKVASTPTESPVFWGWTHNAAFGITLDGNHIADTTEGAVIDLEAGPSIRASKGRVYFKGSIIDTSFGWSPEFLATHQNPTGMTIGNTQAPDPTQLVVSLVGARSVGADTTLRLTGGLINGSVFTDFVYLVPATAPGVPTGLSLLSDTGRSAQDGLTRDGRLTFGAARDASWYEAKVGNGPWLQVPGPGAFMPSGLVQGLNTVAVRAVDAWGTRGPEARISFQLDSILPGSVLPFQVSTAQEVRFQPTGAGDTYEYRVGTGGPWIALGGGPRFTPSGLRTGDNMVFVRATDAAGNIGPAAGISVTLARPTLVGHWVGHDNTDLVGTNTLLRPNGYQDIRINLSGLVADLAIAELTIRGLGGGAWSSLGTGPHWRAAVRRAAGSESAALAFQGYQRESGRPFQVEIRYADGSKAEAWVSGGVAYPNLRVNQPAPRRARGFRPRR